MAHEVFGKTIKVVVCEENFNTVYEKEYIPKELLDEIKKANVLLIPDCVKRGTEEVYTFPESTQEFLEYVKDNSADALKPDIAVDDEDFNKLELHSTAITIATFVVTNIVLPLMVDLVSSFLYDQVKKMHREKENVSAKVNIIVTEENDKKSKMISYEGPVSGVEDALKTAAKDIFKDDSKGD